jgi:hypothetical protein
MGKLAFSPTILGSGYFAFAVELPSVEGVLLIWDCEQLVSNKQNIIEGT